MLMLKKHSRVNNRFETEAIRYVIEVISRGFDPALVGILEF